MTTLKKLHGAALLVFSLAFGCDAEDPETGTGGDRGPLGKVDISDGACFELGHSNHCGGQSAGTCWCDAQCVDFGDCCFDAHNCEEVVGLQGTPCGGIVGDTCAEGLQCVDIPDDGCGPDSGVECPGTCEPIDPTGSPCGGIFTESCGEGFECIAEPGCDPQQVNSCPGTCQPS